MNTSRRFVTPVLTTLLLAASAHAASFQDGFRMLESIATPAMQGAAPVMPITEVLHASKKTVDNRGNEILSYDRFVGRHRVFGEKTIVVFPKSGEAFTVRSSEQNRHDIGELQAFNKAQPSPTISVEQAERIAALDLRQTGRFLSAGVPEAWLSEPENVMYRDTDGKLRLVYHLVVPVSEQGIPTTRDYFIDADNGQIVDAFSRLFEIGKGDPEPTMGSGIGLMSDEVKELPITAHEGKWKMTDGGRNIAISNAELGTPSVDDDHNWESVGTDRPSNQRAEVELYLNFMRIVDFYKARWDYTWEGTVNAVAHAPNPQTGQGNFNNAYFHPWFNAFFFGDGTATENGFDYLGKALDVAGHEFGHGFIDKEGPLTYSGESGALNEHIADLFGACIDDDDWLMGDTITMGVSAGKGLRNMQDPANGHPELITPGMKFAAWRALNRPRPIGDTIYPDHVTKKIICAPSEDNGGVHLNSSIFNKFSYLAATGDGLGRSGLGRQLLADIYVKAMKADLYGSRATFVEFRDALLAAAKLQLEGNANAEAHIATMKAAFAKIGL